MSKHSEKLLLIDGNSIMNRGYFALPLLNNSKGNYTNAILGFLNIFFKIYEEEQPTNIAVTFDLHAPTFRHELYKEYKAGRHKMPEELHEQFPVIKELLKAMNICCCEKEGLESDDLIGTFSRMAPNDMQVVILSGDRDMLQLVKENVLVRIPKTKDKKTVVEDYTPARLWEEYNVTPTEFIDMKGLMGDSSDNIPGVKGIGEKSAAKLISTYHSIENVYQNLDTVTPPGVKAKLEGNEEIALFSKKIATIILDADMDWSIADTAVTKEQIFSEDAYNILYDLELKSILKRFDFSNTISINKIEFTPDIVMINTKEEFWELRDSIINASPSAIGLVPAVNEENEIISLIVGYNNKQYMLNYEDRNYNYIDFISQLSEEGIVISFLSFKQYIDLLNLNNSMNIFDCEVAAYLINPEKSYEPEILSEIYMGVSHGSRKDAFGKVKALDDFVIQDEKIKEYLAFSAFCAERLYDILINRLTALGLYALYYDMEKPVEFVLFDMEKNGIGFDSDFVKKYGEELSIRAEELKTAIYEAAGTEFNINSPKQLGEILFERLKLPYGKKTKTGYSTNVDVLNKLYDEHPIVPMILEYRSLTKLISTYIEGLLSSVGEDGRIHSKFNQTVAATGRLSSTEPNLQNIPTRTSEGKEIRKAFIPEEGYTFVDADYSQIELRVMAHLSDDKALINAFNKSLDIHAITASEVFGVPLDEVDSNLRRKAKAVNFGIIYGISSFGLGQDLDINRKEAEEYINKYFETYKGVDHYLKKMVSDAKKDGYVKTLYGRIRHIPELKSSNYMQRQFGERVAMNSPIQGTAADIIKIAMINVYRELKLRNLKSRLVLQIHDELLIEAAEDEVDKVKEILEKCMMGAAQLSIPLYIDMHTADNLYDAK